MQFVWVDGKQYGIASERDLNGNYMIRRIGQRGPVGDLLTPGRAAYRRVVQQIRDNTA